MTNRPLAQDAQGFLAELNAQLDQLIRRGAELEHGMTSGELTDPTGSVTVSFSRGGDLESIAIIPTWESQLKAEELVSVITETLVKARDGEGATPDPLVMTNEEVAEIRERRLDKMRQRMGVRRTPEELQAVADSLPASLAELNRSFRETIARADEWKVGVSDQPVEVETTSVRSENGMVALQVASGLVVGVTIHGSWLPGKSGNVITECFNEAIRELPAVLAQTTRR